MSKIGQAIGEIHRMDALAARDLWVNRLHPLAKLAVTVGYIALVVSFHKYDFMGLAGMFIYPLALFLLCDLSVVDCFRRLWAVLPLLAFVGALNPVFDKTLVRVGGIVLSAGWFSFATLLIKGVYTVLAAYLLVATTRVEALCQALTDIHVPQVLVTQLLLTWRYITLLLQEVDRVITAYTLRAPGQRGVHISAWGSLAGQLLLRSVDRANAVYESMLLRGYGSPEAAAQPGQRAQAGDWIYVLVWAALLVLFRRVPVLWAVGNLLGGLF